MECLLVWVMLKWMCVVVWDSYCEVLLLFGVEVGSELVLIKCVYCKLISQYYLDKLVGVGVSVECVCVVIEKICELQVVYVLV